MPWTAPRTSAGVVPASLKETNRITLPESIQAKFE